MSFKSLLRYAAVLDLKSRDAQQAEKKHFNPPLSEGLVCFWPKRLQCNSFQLSSIATALDPRALEPPCYWRGAPLVLRNLLFLPSGHDVFSVFDDASCFALCPRRTKRRQKVVVALLELAGAADHQLVKHLLTALPLA